MMSVKIEPPQNIHQSCALVIYPQSVSIVVTSIAKFHVDHSRSPIDPIDCFPTQTQRLSDTP